jgi:hypothetical protein
MNESNLRRILRASAAYDLIVTAGFALPWTAVASLDLLARIHDRLGLTGTTPDVGDPFVVLFTNLFGTVVVIWSVVRLITPTPLLGAADTVGRAAFAAWMAVALGQGATTVIVGFLVLELVWGVVQGFAVAAFLRRPQRRTVAV